ncbi:chemoreceptor glutamine deamidase CheD [Mangrovitalea sediminis]|uniref:chemoreceptor glutamine deamidase CheD n=1 Tax=Mangrovitalea sediminis TaxID=1982043 RepID=UPI000BE596E6|nr:chemoreceptor glutamine deamidase CheD [Mangrovitalea sediminis]
MNFDNNPFMAPNRYYDRHFEREAVKILPGEYYVTKAPTLIVTVLGSCVSACIRDPATRIGGMNHFMLPGSDDLSNSLVGESARYGAYAMEILINHLLKLGASRDRLEAKVFGGGNVLKGFSVNRVGHRNAEFVLEYLKNESIPLLASDVAGEYPRKIYYFPDTGKVLVRKIRTLHNATILDRESEYRLKVRQTAGSGSVDLFE